MLGVLLTKWTIRLALACFVAYLAGWLALTTARWPRAARWIWTAGCGMFLIHVACAFHFYHHWSHFAAWQATAEQTEQILGIAFGNGIYFNYLFLVLWALDVAWLWRPGSHAARAALGATGVPPPAHAKHQTPKWRVLVHLFLFFIAFNGAIVFEPGPTRWAGLCACCVVAALAGRRAYNSLRAGRNLPACESIHAEQPTGSSNDAVTYDGADKLENRQAQTLDV